MNKRMNTPKAKQGVVFVCTQCGREYTKLIYLCVPCSKNNTPSQPPRGILKARYDYGMLRKKHKDFASLKRNRFIDLLPLHSSAALPQLNIGNTPLYAYNELDGKPLPYHFYIKDDSQNPTFSGKDRASALVSAFAKEQGINTIVAASTGNAGSSLAGICAAQRQQAIILVPETAPLAKITQIMLYGARLITIKGTYDQAYELSIQLTKKYGWFNRNTAYNPLTIEGKKTTAYEICDQLASIQPGRVFVPSGDGVILSALYRGFEDLLALGMLKEMPVIVAVQSENSDNLVRNLSADTFLSNAATTIADSISVDVPRNFLMAKQMITKYHGEGITVSDAAIMKASSVLARNTGIFAEPAAAAAFAGLLKYHREGRLLPGSQNIVLSTGSGLKDLVSVQKMIQQPKPIDADIATFDIFDHKNGKGANL